jgi:hypothetical protein
MAVRAMKKRMMIHTAALLTMAFIAMWASAETVSAEYEANLEHKNQSIGQVRESTADLSAAFKSMALKSGALKVDLKREDIEALIPRSQMISLSAQTMVGTLSPEQMNMDRTQKKDESAS